MKHLRPKRLVAPIVGVALLFSLPVFADQLADMATRLSKLRAEVERLSEELAMESADGRDRLRSLARQKADLELEAKKEQTRTAKVRRAIREKRKAVEESRAQDSEMAPLFETSIVQVREYVQTTLPFRTADRLAELEKLESQYKSGLVSAPKAVNRLWSFMEDEFRLTRENGLYQQSITVDGQPQLAEVVRIGMVMMYFKAGEDTVGRAIKKDGKWAYEVIGQDEEKQEVLKLFITFKKQIRQGYFQIPNALPAISTGGAK